MSNETFNFMDQNSRIEDLLQACVAALPHLPEPQKETLIKELRGFEKSGAPMMWSSDDVDDARGLTENEKCEAIGRFIQECTCRDSDWEDIERHARDVLEQRVLCIRVMYDPLYTGGEYDGTPIAAYIPLDLIKEFARQIRNDDGVEMAFTKTMKIDCMHIVQYDLDVHYNQYQEQIENDSVAA